MGNALTQVDALENVGIDIGTGFNHPSCAVRQGFVFGWGGSSTRSSTLATAVAISTAIAEEVVSLAAAATSDSVANLLPANSLIGMILTRQLVTTTTTATLSFGDATTAARFKAGVAIAATTTAVCLDHWSGAVTTLAAGPSQAAAAKIRITPNAVPGNALGTVALQVWSITGIPPTA